MILRNPSVIEKIMNENNRNQIFNNHKNTSKNGPFQKIIAILINSEKELFLFSLLSPLIGKDYE